MPGADADADADAEREGLAVARGDTLVVAGADALLKSEVVTLAVVDAEGGTVSEAALPLGGAEALAVATTDTEGVVLSDGVAVSPLVPEAHREAVVEPLPPPLAVVAALCKGDTVGGDDNEGAPDCEAAAEREPAAERLPARVAEGRLVGVVDGDARHDASALAVSDAVPHALLLPPCGDCDAVGQGRAVGEGAAEMDARNEAHALPLSETAAGVSLTSGVGVPAPEGERAGEDVEEGVAVE